jgi:hypothetical protein
VTCWRFPLPLWLAILLGVLWLGVLCTVAFTALRLWGNLKALFRSLRALGEQLTPALGDLAARARDTTEVAERLRRSQARVKRDQRLRAAGRKRRR